MKKFTVISLLLVLVAGFAFAGLAPYSTAGYTIASKGDLEDKFQGLSVSGKFVAGVIANDLVDINFDIATSLKKGTYIADTNPNFGNYVFGVTPALNVEYADEKLTAGVKFALPLEYVAVKLLDVNGDTPDYKFDVDAFATYTNALKDGKNILTVAGDADFVFSANKMNAALLAKATVVSDDLVVGARGFFDFNAVGGILGTDFAKGAEASLVYDYKDVEFTGSASIANFSILACDLLGAKPYKYFYGNDDYEVVAFADATYEWTKAVGASKLDKYDFVADANITVDKFGGEKMTVANGSLSIALPHLVPVELIPNMGLNLPATLSLTADYYVEEAVADYNFNAKLHLAYFEFAKKVSVFDETIDSLDVTFTYGNDGWYTSKFEDVAHYHNIGANVTLKLSKGSLVFDFANSTMGAEVADFLGAVPPVNTVSLTYTKTY